MTIRVFYVNEFDYYAGDCTPEEILAKYMADTGCTREESMDIDMDVPRELSVQELLDKQFIYENEEFLPIPQTFRSYLDELIAKNTIFPHYFVSLE